MTIHKKSSMGTVVIFSDITLQETLNSILQVTVKAETMRELLNESANIISNNFNISMLGIYLYDEDTGTLRIRASKGLKKDVLKVVGLQYVSEGLPEYLQQLSAKKRRSSLMIWLTKNIHMGYGDIDERLGIKSAIGIPLLTGNTVQGSITLLQVDDKGLSGEEIHMLETVCGQLAMSISKIRGAEDERIFQGSAISPHGRAQRDHFPDDGWRARRGRPGKIDHAEPVLTGHARLFIWRLCEIV